MGKQNSWNLLNKLGLRKTTDILLFQEPILLEKENAMYFLVNWLNKNKPKLEKKGIQYFTGKTGKNLFYRNKIWKSKQENQATGSMFMPLCILENSTFLLLN